MTSLNKPALYRALGFAVPTLVLITLLHLTKDASVGEAVEGLVSGSWFSVVFLIALMLRMTTGAALSDSAAREVLLGVAAAVVAWLLIWLFWQLPPTDPLREHAWIGFALNSAIIFMIGLGFPGLGARKTRSAQ